jgi:hypothetical protein
MIKAIFMVDPLIRLGNSYLIVNVGFGQRWGGNWIVDCGLLHCRFAASTTYFTPSATYSDQKEQRQLPFQSHFSLFLTAALEPNAGFAYNGARFIYYRPEP